MRAQAPESQGRDLLPVIDYCNVMPADAGGLARLTAAELEFIAEDQLIEIVPKFKHGTLHLIQGDFGPFVPQARAKVPLWLAITLKKRQK